MEVSFIVVDNRSGKRMIYRIPKRLTLVNGKASILLDFNSRSREKFLLLVINPKLKYQK